MADVKVFVSYSWGVEEKTKVVDEIEMLCLQRGINLIHDKDAMQHGDVIMDFMDGLTSGDHIITVFSKSYFKSPWCMYELLQISQKGKLQQRTHPVIADDCDLSNDAYRMDSVEYWVEEHKKLENLLAGRDPSLFVDEFKKLNMLRDISQNANALMNFAAGRLNTPLLDLRAQSYAQILDKIQMPESNGTELVETNSKEVRVIALDSGKARKIKQLEERIYSLEDTLHNFEMELDNAYHHAQKSSLKKDIKEKQDQLTDKYQQYRSLILGLDEDVFSEGEAEPIIAELIEVVDNEPENLSDEIKGQLELIRQEIKDQSKSATAKLKFALPIVPGLASYELELDTENFLGEVWGKVRGLLKKKATNQVNP